MKMTTWIRTLGVVCAVGLMLACGSGEEKQAAQRDAEFAAIKEQKAALEAKRLEVSHLEQQIAASEAMDEEAEEAEEAAPAEGEEEMAEGEMAPAEDLEQQLSAAQDEAAAMGEEFMTNLVNFLNSANMVQGEEPTGSLLEAIRLKSGEDMLIAQEYIRKGGDYRRAIEILQTAQMLDPNNPDLQAAIDQAESDQYMTEERFAEVSKGMTMDQVRDVLGTVNLHNVRQYPEKKVTAWFYRREDKGAAGVYFQDKDGQMVVYRADYDAIKPGGEESEEG